MFQEFYKDTIESKFIKNLIYNTPIPRMQTVSYGDILYENGVYLFGQKVIRCTKTGILSQGDAVNVLCNVFFDEKTGNPKYGVAEYDYLAPYSPARKYPKLNENYKSKYNYYDSDTHRYLGDFLRAYRDVYGVNLMPFYNCFTDNQVTGVYLDGSYDTVKGEYDGSVIEEDNRAYKIYAVPIKFGKVYTIAVDCNDLSYKPSIRNTLGEITIVGTDGQRYAISNSMKEQGKYHIRTSFTKPFTVYFEPESKESTITCADDIFCGYDPENQRDLTICGEFNGTVLRSEDIVGMSNYLNLLIQVPVNNKSSIVVLEGDFTDNGNIKIFNKEFLDKGTRVFYSDMLGDFDWNGKVDENDVALIIKYSVGGSVPVGIRTQNGDVNLDNCVNSKDANLITRFLNGKPSVPGIGEYTYSSVSYYGPIYSNNLDELLVSELSLLKANSGVSYAFSDRLIEYLLLNAICSSEEITENVIKVQDIFGSYEGRSDGVYSNYLRCLLFESYSDVEDVYHIDNIGYMDKDVEWNEKYVKKAYEKIKKDYEGLPVLEETGGGE